LDNHEGVQRGEIKAAPNQADSGKTPADAIRAGAAPNVASVPVDDGDQTPDVEPSITSRAWWVQNGPVLAIVFALLVFLFMKFDSEGLLAILKAALGLSLVIFLHELGHFLAAKWCDVHVTTFSIGFGPAIPGCSYKWGETTYKLALFPLGGYVQMVGQVDGDEASDGSEDDPRSYRNKSVGQRMLIISAGVIMNVILAVICFVVVFRGPGKDRVAGVIGGVESGSPGFRAGLRSREQILEIGGLKDPYFDKDLMPRVMALLPGEKIELVCKLPGAPEERFDIEPRNNSAMGDKKNVIGLAFADAAELLPKRLAPAKLPTPARPDSPAAKSAFKYGDKIVATTDPDQPDAGGYDPNKRKDLPDDPRFPNHGRRDFFELAKRLQILAGKDIVLWVERDEQTSPVAVPLAPTFYQTLGFRLQMGRVTAVRDGSPAAKAGVLVRRKVNESWLRGDLITKVEVLEADGTATVFEAGLDPEKMPPHVRPLDPERLPFELRQWANRRRAAEQKADAKNAKPWEVKLTVRRDQADAQPRETTAQLTLTWDDGWRFDRVFPGKASPEAIPELGLAYQIQTIVDYAPEGNPLKSKDALREMRITYKDPDSSDTKIELTEELEQGAYVAALLQGTGIEKVTFKVWRDKKEVDVTVSGVIEDKTWPVSDSGLLFAHDMRRQKAHSMAEAVELGFSDTWENMKQVFQNLRGIAIGTISKDQLGGPVTIATVAYRFARMDFWEFVFFLGLISVNLAVINFLPIPVLDGGHFVFLLYEKLRGKPAPEGVRIGATYAGLALILCLMVFVLYLDFSRLL
jgi:regulator of sigma E protease